MTEPLTIRQQYRNAYRGIRIARSYDGTQDAAMSKCFSRCALYVKSAAMISFRNLHSNEPSALRKALELNQELLKAEAHYKRRVELLRTVNNHLENRLAQFETVLETLGFHHEDDPQVIINAFNKLREWKGLS